MRHHETTWADLVLPVIAPWCGRFAVAGWTILVVAHAAKALGVMP